MRQSNGLGGSTSVSGSVIGRLDHLGQVIEFQLAANETLTEPKGFSKGFSLGHQVDMLDREAETGIQFLRENLRHRSQHRRGIVADEPLYGNAFRRANDDERTSPLGDWYDLRRDDYPHWIKPLYENAFHRANDDERAAALVDLEDWLKGRRWAD